MIMPFIEGVLYQLQMLTFFILDWMFLRNFDKSDFVGILYYLGKGQLWRCNFIENHLSIQWWAQDRTGFNESLTCDSAPLKSTYISSSSHFKWEAQFSTEWRICFLTIIGLRVQWLFLTTIYCKVLLQQLY